MKRLPCALLTVLMLSPVLPVAADELRLYRYTNDQGNLVIEPSIPPEYVAKGYEIINTKGRVLEVIAPAPTAAELVELREAELRALAEQQADKQQQDNDEALLSTYSSPADVMQALDRALEEVDARITVEQGNVRRSQMQKEQRQARAAQMERSGRAVPKSLVQEISQYELQIQRHEKRVEELQQVKRTTRLKYIADQRRLEALLAIDSVRAGDWPETLDLESSQLPGLWSRRMDDGAHQEWVLNPSGSFTSLREQKDGRRQLILGNWALQERELAIEVTTQHLTDTKGSTQILSNPPPRKYRVLDFNEHELVLQVGQEVVRLRRQ